jgi:hypothetical protein
MQKLIDADKLKQHYAWWDNEDKKIFDTIVDLQPTVDAKPVRHGHWIKANDPMSSPFDTMKRCLCSECREWAAVTSYCPNCGARMDEEGEDEGA